MHALMSSPSRNSIWLVEFCNQSEHILSWITQREKNKLLIDYAFWLEIRTVKPLLQGTTRNLVWKLYDEVVAITHCFFSQKKEECVLPESMHDSHGKSKAWMTRRPKFCDLGIRVANSSTKPDEDGSRFNMDAILLPLLGLRSKRWKKKVLTQPCTRGDWT